MYSLILLSMVFSMNLTTPFWTLTTSMLCDTSQNGQFLCNIFSDQSIPFLIFLSLGLNIFFAEIRTVWFTFVISPTVFNKCRIKIDSRHSVFGECHSQH